MTTAYEELQTRFRHIKALHDAHGILNRDMITVMREGSSNSRLQQMVTLDTIAHEKQSDPKIKTLLKQAADDLPAENRDYHEINLQLMERLHIHASCVPEELASKNSRLATFGEQNQTKWRAEENWKEAREHLSDIFQVKREIALIKQQALGTEEPYDALIDEFDPYSSAQKIAAVFQPLEQFLVENIPAAHEKTKNQPQPEDRLQGPFPKDKQGKLFTKVAEAMGFDFSRGRMEMIPAHPSCYGAIDDQRFTTRIDEEDFIEPLRATVHEVGHGLYEQNLPRSWHYQPVGESIGMTIHESQSLFWERQIALSPSFYRWLASRVQSCLEFNDVDLNLIKEHLFAHKTTVEPSYIRIEADEMTYPLHIFLRFDLERKMISGELSIDELPDAWNAGMESRLGVTPASLRDGCLQDVHWFGGAIGYFPSYTLGAMCAAQIEAAMQRDLGDLDRLIEQGEFSTLLQWLTEHIHALGSYYKPMDLMRHATGEALNAQYLIDHLTRRYLC